MRWMERRTPGGRGYRLGQGLRGDQLWLHEVDGKADARRERISAWAGTDWGIQLWLHEVDGKADARRERISAWAGTP